MEDQVLVRPLPLQIRPYPDETTQSFLHRLETANALHPGQLKKALQLTRRPWIDTLPIWAGRDPETLALAMPQLDQHHSLAPRQPRSGGTPRPACERHRLSPMRPQPGRRPECGNLHNPRTSHLPAPQAMDRRRHPRHHGPVLGQGLPRHHRRLAPPQEPHLSTWSLPCSHGFPHLQHHQLALVQPAPPLHPHHGNLRRSDGRPTAAWPQPGHYCRFALPVHRFVDRRHRLTVLGQDRALTSTRFVPRADLQQRHRRMVTNRRT